jgi:lysophospholipase
MTGAAVPFAPSGPPDGESAIATTGGEVRWLRAADGVPLRAAHWPVSHARATVLLLNGRAEFLEKHLESVAELTGRGFSVWSLDWRGQGRSGRLLPDPLKGHVRDFGDYVADLALLVREHVRLTLGGRPLHLLAHSMGGNVGLRFLAAYPGAVASAVLSAPMVDFRRDPRMTLRRALLVTELLCRLPGGAARYNGWHRRRALDNHAGFEGNPFTGCHLRLDRTAAWLSHDPGLRVATSTWGWSRAALRSAAVLATLEPSRLPDIPILVLAAKDERVTDNDAIARFVARLPRGRLAVIPEARHELMGQADVPRARFWAEWDAFMDEPSAQAPAPATKD